ncbi:hypothetical protein MYX76_09545 [Desulfobacterota bacterium AH_259_B03_O07]|nr:hypothetical protein [Desulfobacterota bacterium AH_259_B03_O07]
MTSPRLKKIKNLVREIKFLQEEREAHANELIWAEADRWFHLKKEVMSGEDNVKSWASFLRDLEIPLSTADFKIDTYKKWVHDLGYPPKDLRGIHIQKLRRAVPYAKTKNDAGKILKKAREITSLGDFLTWLKDTYR